MIDNSITEITLIKLRQMSYEEAAVALDDSDCGALKRLWKRSFITKEGVILHEVKQRLLWAKHLDDDSETGEPYTSFDRWVLRLGTALQVRLLCCPESCGRAERHTPPSA